MYVSYDTKIGATNKYTIVSGIWLALHAPHQIYRHLLDELGPSKSTLSDNGKHPPPSHSVEPLRPPQVATTDSTPLTDKVHSEVWQIGGCIHWICRDFRVSNQTCHSRSGSDEYKCHRMYLTVEVAAPSLKFGARSASISVCILETSARGLPFLSSSWRIGFCSRNSSSQVYLPQVVESLLSGPC